MNVRDASVGNEGEVTAAVPLRLALVGQGIGLSRTPPMHQAEARAQGFSCRYDLIDTDTASGAPGTLAEIIARAEADGFAGLNVTYPYKREALALTDTLSDAARTVGAVNTIVFGGGARHGHNTDLWGFAESFRRGLPDVPLGTVLLIGAGGAGAAVAHALAGLGAGRILIADTCRKAAEALAGALRPAGIATATQDLAAAAAAADGIVNATPVGMAKLPGIPIDPSLLSGRHFVADIIYFPLETELLAAARAAGCATLRGEGMAVFQAVRAFELFTGRPANADRMRATFNALGAA
ncbi:MAG: shikimate dehydrogenase [Acuticoccus sp.]